MIEGACLCGAVRILLSGALTSPRLCHCANCRKFSGTSPAAWAMAKRAELTVQPAEPNISRYDSGRGLRCFCNVCGGPVWFESLDYPEIVGIPLGVIDNGDVPPPEVHLWVSSKPAWCTLQDNLPRLTEGPE